MVFEEIFDENPGKKFVLTATGLQKARGPLLSEEKEGASVENFCELLISDSID